MCVLKIGQALNGNRSMVTLDLGGNNVGPDGIKVLAAAIRDNDNLRSLELSYNPIGSAGAKAIADVAKFNMKVAPVQKEPIFEIIVGTADENCGFLYLICFHAQHGFMRAEQWQCALAAGYLEARLV